MNNRNWSYFDPACAVDPERPRLAVSGNSRDGGADIRVRMSVKNGVAVRIKEADEIIGNEVRLIASDSPDGDLEIRVLVGAATKPEWAELPEIRRRKVQLEDLAKMVEENPEAVAEILAKVKARTK